jgi:hypothetical protein
MQPLNAEVRTVDSLIAAEIGEMFELYESYYDATSNERFQQDLQQKQYVIQLRDPDSRLRGFSTLALIDYHFNGQHQRAIYSGDTVIHDAYWGGQALPLAWAHLAGRIKAEAPTIPLYWLLIVKGHRTYRYLTLFSNEHFPNRRHPTPPKIQALMDFLAQKQFGEAYQVDEGIVRYPHSHGHLKKAWATTPDHLLKKPNVRFFLERNPGYAKGDELVCFTELGIMNLRSHVLRAFTDASSND